MVKESPGHSPAITGSAIATGAIDAHIDIVVNGKTGTAMQAFKEQLSAADIAAVVTYQRNALVTQWAIWSSQALSRNKR